MKSAPRENEALIAGEIASLVVTLERVPEEHHLAMRSQMDALAGRLTHTQVWDAFDLSEDGGNYSTYAAKDSALDAVEWMNGENPEAPSARWLRVAKQRGAEVLA